MNLKWSSPVTVRNLAKLTAQIYLISCILQAHFLKHIFHKVTLKVIYNSKTVNVYFLYNIININCNLNNIVLFNERLSQFRYIYLHGLYLRHTTILFVYKHDDAWYFTILWLSFCFQ